MKSSRLILVVTAVFVLTLSGRGGAGAQSGSRGVFGYLNPETGTFLPAAPKVAPSAATLTTVAGTLVVKFTLTLKTVFAKKSKILCTVEADVIDVNTTIFFEFADLETATAQAVGNSCTVTLPYAFHLVNTKTDALTLSFLIANSSGEPSRTSMQFIDTISPVPTGNTTEDVSATL